MPHAQPVERHSAPVFRPALVYARANGAAGEHGQSRADRILLVEDDYLVAMQAESALLAAGFDVVGIAVTAEEAIEMAAASGPALVVMDIRLAGKRDGIDAALDLFRKQGTRCIFATAHDDGQARARAKPSNPLGWLPKPYSMPALVEMVRRCLGDLQSD
jgi:two-component system, response regulator PdtaR